MSMDALSRFNQIREELAMAGGEDEQLQVQLHKAIAALETRVKDVLGPALTIDNAALTSLQSSEVGFTAALGSGAITYSPDALSTRGEEAAELLSALSELEETNPDIAKSLTSAIARSKTDAVLQSAPQPGPTPKPSKSQSKEVTKRALSLRRAEEVAGYLASPEVLPSSAADAVMELAVVNPKLAESTLRKLPRERVTEMTVGLLSIGRKGILGLMVPSQAASLVLRQFQNDQNPEKGLTDRNNMSAAYLLWHTVDTHEKPNAVLASLDPKLIEAIINFDYSYFPFMQDESYDAQESLRSYMNVHKQKINQLRERRERKREKAAAESPEEKETVPPAAPKVDLDQDIDLDQI
jgi:hypothetical protein